MVTPLVDLEIGIYSPTGVPRNLDERRVLPGVSWEVLENGGLGRATIPLAAPFEGTRHSSSPIAAGDTVKIWANGETYPRYIGTVSDRDRTLSIPEGITYTAYGEMERMNHIKCLRQQIARPGGADLAVFAQDLLDDYNTKRGTSYTGDFVTTGITLDLLTLDRASVRAGFGQLATIAQGAIVWGWEVNPANGQLRMYLRPRTTAVGWQKSVGNGVRLLGERLPLSDVVNTLTPLVGAEGRAQFPNTLGDVAQTSDGKANTRFDYPVPAGTQANCIVNAALIKGGGFIHPVWWTPSGSVWNGAAGHLDGDGVRLTPGDYIQQTRQNVDQSRAQKIQPGHTYRIGVWGRQEVGGDTRAVTVTLKWLNSGGSQVGSTETFTLQPAAALWEEYGDPLNAYKGLQSVAPSTAAGFQIKILGAASGGGTSVFVDDPYLYDVSATTQPGWEVYDPGANLTSVDWSHAGGYEDAPYCVRIIAGAGTSSSDGDNITLRATGGRPAVAPGQNITIGVWYKSGPGASSTPELNLRSVFRTSGGDNAEYVGFAFVEHNATVPASGAPTLEWTFLGDSYIATGSTATTDYDIQVNGPGDVLFSCALVMDAAGRNFIPGRTYERRTSVADTDLAPYLSTAALASITNYGSRETDLSLPNVIAWDTATVQDVAAWLNKHAVLTPPRSLELDNDTEYITPATGTRLRISGVEESLSDQWPSRVVYTWTGKLSLDIELGDPAPQLSTVLARAGSSASASSGGVASSGSSAILPALTAPITVAQGGTGATDAAAARTALGLGSGLSVTVPLAKLSTGGANGSLTFTNGILAAKVDPT